MFEKCGEKENMIIKMISAVSMNGVIGQYVEGKPTIPWSYPEDMKFFRQMTTGGEVIFGRKTFESIGRPLPKRNNIVITSQEKIEGVSCFKSLEDWKLSRALVLEDVAVTKWICGGASIYRDGMRHASEIYITLIPEEITGDNLVLFPWINPEIFKHTETIDLENSNLKVLKYTKV